MIEATAVESDMAHKDKADPKATAAPDAEDKAPSKGRPTSGKAKPAPPGTRAVGAGGSRSSANGNGNGKAAGTGPSVNGRTSNGAAASRSRARKRKRK